MAKYIRTKAKIYEVESEYINNEGKWIGYNIVGDDMALILREQVINQSDNLAELCDEFVEVYKVLKNKVFEKPYFDVVSKQVRNGSPVGNLYGAIWTDKGLIYVAKMNDEGVLCLI